MKKIISLFIMIILVLSLSACNTQSKSTTNSNTSDIASNKESSNDDATSKDAVESTDSPVVETPAQPEKPQEIPTVPNDISYDIAQLKAAIDIYNNYANYGAACGYERADSVSVEEIEPYTTDVQKDIIYNIYPEIYTLKCHTINEEKSHLSQYLAANMYQNFDADYFIEANNKLYIMCGAKGSISFDGNISDSDITRTAYNKISVKTELYGSGGDFCNYVKIDFEYQNGTYKIVKKTDI